MFIYSFKREKSRTKIKIDSHQPSSLFQGFFLLGPQSYYYNKEGVCNLNILFIYEATPSYLKTYWVWVGEPKPVGLKSRNGKAEIICHKAKNR